MSDSTPSSTTSSTTFGEISASALHRQNDVIDIINKVRWNEGNLFLLIPPTHHLVDIAYKNIKQYAQDKGLSTERYRLSDQEVSSYTPTITRKAGGYYVCIATDKMLAKATIEAERIRRKDRKKLPPPAESELKLSASIPFVKSPAISDISHAIEASSSLKELPAAAEASTPLSSTGPAESSAPSSLSSFPSVTPTAFAAPNSTENNEIEAILQFDRLTDMDSIYPDATDLPSLPTIPPPAVFSLPLHHNHNNNKEEELYDSAANISTAASEGYGDGMFMPISPVVSLGGGTASPPLSTLSPAASTPLLQQQSPVLYNAAAPFSGDSSPQLPIAPSVDDAKEATSSELQITGAAAGITGSKRKLSFGEEA
jgi:hypothetical protein